MVLKASPALIVQLTCLAVLKKLGVNDGEVKVSLCCTEPLARHRKLTAVGPVLKPLETMAYSLSV